MQDCRDGKVGLLSIIIGLVVAGPGSTAAPGQMNGANRPATIAEDSIENKRIELPSGLEGKDPAEKDLGQRKLWGSSSYWLALGLVVFIILVAAAVLRKAYPAGRMFSSLPGLQVLGRTYLSPKQALALVKIDHRLVLVGLTEHNVTHLLTITDPDEISRLLGQIEQNRSNSITNSFFQLFSSERKNFTEQGPSNPSNISEDTISGEAQSDDISDLKSRLNSLLDKVNRLKGNGGRE